MFPGLAFERIHCMTSRTACGFSFGVSGSVMGLIYGNRSGFGNGFLRKGCPLFLSLEFDSLFQAHDSNRGNA